MPWPTTEEVMLTAPLPLACAVFCESVGELSRSVGRPVVYHEDLEAGVLLEDGADEARNVLTLVVCGDDH